MSESPPTPFPDRSDLYAIVIGIIGAVLSFFTRVGSWISLVALAVLLVRITSVLFEKAGTDPENASPVRSR